MKKQIALLALLLTLSVVALCMIGASVAKENDRVTVTEQALYGDPSFAKDATVMLEAHFDEHLLWNTAYTPGGAAQTEYDFSAKELEFDRKYIPNGVALDFDIQYGYDLSIPLEETTGIQRAYRELYDATAPGTKGTKTIRLQDYYTYYPVRVEIDLPGTLWHGWNYEDLSEDGFANERAVWDAFNEFLKIPIPEDLPAFEISVTKDESGREIGIGSGTPSDKEGNYSLYAESAYTSDRCFFAINNRIGDGYIDTSLIPGGYGIYSFAYTNVRNEKNTQGNATIYHPGYLTGVDADSLAMVYPLDERVHIRSMYVNPEETRLLLLTDEADGAICLTVIDIATMTELQKLHITYDAYVSLNQQDDFIILFYSRKFSVYTIGEDGTYSHAITADQPDVTDESFSDINTYAAMDFDGERLIMADLLLESQYQTMQTCNFCLAVYDSTGLLYYGEYRNSLSVNPDTSRYSYNCIPNEIAVVWK